jgi:hypothetical protein
MNSSHICWASSRSDGLSSELTLFILSLIHLTEHVQEHTLADIGSESITKGVCGGSSSDQIYSVYHCCTSFYSTGLSTLGILLLI